MVTGVHVKRYSRPENAKLPRIEVFKEAGLRHVGKDSEGYFFKIDCDKDEEGSLIQVHVFLRRYDIDQAIQQWLAIRLEEC